MKIIGRGVRVRFTMFLDRKKGVVCRKLWSGTDLDTSLPRYLWGGPTGAGRYSSTDHNPKGDALSVRQHSITHKSSRLATEIDTTKDTDTLAQCISQSGLAEALRS